MLFHILFIIVLMSGFIFLFVQRAAGLPIFYFLTSLFANLFLAKKIYVDCFWTHCFFFFIELILIIFPLHRLVWGQLFFLKLDWCFYQVWLSEISWTLSFNITVIIQSNK